MPVLISMVFLLLKSTDPTFNNHENNGENDKHADVLQEMQGFNVAFGWEMAVQEMRFYLQLDRAGMHRHRAQSR
jgi:hypothetical protein